MMMTEPTNEGDMRSSVPNEATNGPLLDSDSICIGPAVESTAHNSVARPVTPPMGMDDPAEPLRSNSAQPSTEEEMMGKILPQESLNEAKLRNTAEVCDSPTSLPRQSTEFALNGKLPSLSEEEFEELLKSPRGENVIVEQSPGGRYVRFMEKLGSGASKDVYRAYDTTEGIEVAWNVVNLAGVPKAERNRIVNEVRLLERLHHHNIISFHGSWVNRERQEVNFVTEILSSGTLKSFIEKVQVIRWKIAKRWAIQILNGLEYLHQQDPPVIHRDLKGDNIFINGTSGDLRIGDLGLSTVHRNGKVLSVLGTPEFMAPDLYEEACYDEKVDIYAFGMVMLEIFTKDIPYRECINPAQIYRKVMQGEPPQSLGRVRSTEARDFIMLCLGHKNEETGCYERPSAAELLKHPFLKQGADDDSEVEVDPLLQERTIREGSREFESQSGGSKGVTTHMHLTAPALTTTEPNEKATARENCPAAQAQSPIASHRDGGLPRPTQNIASQNSMDDGSDHFDEMPDSEVNIVKKVKVMMGRGQELESPDVEPPAKDSTSGVSSAGENNVTRTRPATEQESAQPGISQGSESTGQAALSQAPQPHYLVAAAVIEEESLVVRPYEDDILKLIIRLPVEGKTQNVQFDFHLVEDEPVQVAKEMVAELGIPQEVVLEISEAISGLARTARMKQDKHRQRKQQEQMGQNTQGVVQPLAMMHQQPLEEQQVYGVVQQEPQYMNQNFPAAPVLGPAPPSEGYQAAPPPMSQPMASSGYHQQSAQALPPHQVQPGEGLRIGPPQALQTRSTSSGQQQQPMYPHASQVSVEHSMPAPSHSHLHYVPGPSETAQQPQSMAPIPLQVEDQSMFVQAQPQHAQVSAQTENQVSFVHAQSQHAQVVAQADSQSVFVHAPPQHAQVAAQADNQSAFVQAQHQHAQVAAQAENQSSFVQAQSQHAQVATHSHLHYVAGLSEMAQQPQSMAPIPLQVEDQSMFVQVQPQHDQVAAQADDQSAFVQAQPQHTHVAAQPENQSSFVQAQSQHAQVATQADNQSAFVQAQHQYPQALPPPTERTVAQGEAPPVRPPANTEENGRHILPRKPSELSMAEPHSDDEDDDDDDDGSELREEMRRLDDDFKKNMLRTQKVFYSRMDSLQRSQEEREAQHLKTLEKHEKERAEFEKRLLQAEKEQNRRIEQLQKEWDAKRKRLARHKAAKKPPQPEAPKTAPEDERSVLRMTQENADSLASIREKSSLRSSDSERSLSGGESSGNNSAHGVS